MRKELAVTAVAACLLLASGRTVAAQETQAPQGPAAQESQKQPPPPPQRPSDQRPAEERAFGSVTSVGVDRFEIKRMDGAALTVLVDSQTRYREEQKEIQLEDLKPGDRVLVRGRLNDKQELAAALVRRVTEEQMARFRDAAGDRTFGEIVSIEKGQLKVRNRMQNEKIVIVNEQTAYVKDGQPITLSDLKVGDRIFALGKETDGQFVARRVFTGQFRREGEWQRQGEPKNP
jgi:uncharacterized protein DUF5666